MKYFIVLGLLVVLGSAFGRWRYETARGRARKQKMRSGLTGAQVAAKLLDSDPLTRGKYRIVEHDTTLTDFYSPSKKKLFLSKYTCRAKSAAAWGVALHEAGHVIQDRKGDPSLKPRRLAVKFAQFGGGLALFVGAFLATPLVPVITPRIAIMMVAGVWFLCLLGVLLSVGVEYAANRWAREKLEELRVLRCIDEEDEVEAMMAGSCWREVADVVRSPILFIHHLVPLLGRKAK